MIFQGYIESDQPGKTALDNIFPAEHGLKYRPPYNKKTDNVATKYRDMVDIKGKLKDTVTINSMIEGLRHYYNPWAGNTHQMYVHSGDPQLVKHPGPVFVRGLGPQTHEVIRNASNKGQDIYFCDNDYIHIKEWDECAADIKAVLWNDHRIQYDNKFEGIGITGGGASLRKIRHVTRITKNAYFVNKLRKSVPWEHLRRIEFKKDQIMKTMGHWGSMGSGKYILVCPSSKLMENRFDEENWTERTVNKLKQYTDRPIKVREKPFLKKEHIPLGEDLKDAYACVTMCSKVAIDAVIAGVPSVCDRRSMAAPVSRTKLADIESPLHADCREEWVETLLLNQFTIPDMISGLAWDWLVNHQ